MENIFRGSNDVFRENLNKIREIQTTGLLSQPNLKGTTITTTIKKIETIANNVFRCINSGVSVISI